MNQRRPNGSKYMKQFRASYVFGIGSLESCGLTPVNRMPMAFVSHAHVQSYAKAWGAAKIAAQCGSTARQSIVPPH